MAVSRFVRNKKQCFLPYEPAEKNMKVEWLQKIPLEVVPAGFKVLGLDGSAAAVCPASLLSGGDPALTMWLGSGASSGSPHMVFDSPLSAVFMLLRFPYLSSPRFGVFGPKSESECFYLDSVSGSGVCPLSNRLSGDRRGVFEAWDNIGCVYVVFQVL